MPLFIKDSNSGSAQRSPLLGLLWMGLGILGTISGCSTAAPVKTQQYAALKTSRTFEYELPLVWKGIEHTLRNQKVIERDPEEVDETRWPKLMERTLTTDWIYSESRDKYVEYRINDSPRKKYLQIRHRYLIQAKRVMGGTEVFIRPQEEVEKVDTRTGAPVGYEESQPDTGRSAEMLERIQNGIFAQLGRV